MLVVKKGEALKRLSKGLVPFLVVIGVLDLLAALEPDVSIAMLFTLLMALAALRGRSAKQSLHRARGDVLAAGLRQDRKVGVRA